MVNIAAGWLADEMSPIALPAVPLVDLVGPPGPALLRLYPERAADLLASARRCYGVGFLALADPLSRRWAIRHDIPYCGEIAEIAGATPRRRLDAQSLL